MMVYNGVATMRGMANPYNCIVSLHAYTPKCVVKNVPAQCAKNGLITSQNETPSSLQKTVMFSNLFDTFESFDILVQFKGRNPDTFVKEKNASNVSLIPRIPGQNSVGNRVSKSINLDILESMWIFTDPFFFFD